MAVSNKKYWWKNAIVYQIYPRSFCDSNGDGIGDIPGIISKLHYLKDLGVDIIWLSPVYKSPNCDNGYDIADYRDINPEFGTMEDMDRLISRAKRFGIKIIMDLVINHTSDEHEWFQKALAGDPKYKDFYYFRKGNAKKPPNNWGSFFGGDVWEPVGNDEYYLHLFSKKQPDLNWGNPAVYDEITDIMRFWLKKGIAGFRCDVINIIFKNSLEDGKKQLALTGKEHYLTTDGCHDLLMRFNREVWSPAKAFTVGETVLVDTKEAKLLTDEARGELNTAFFFEHMDVDSIGVKWFKKNYQPQNLILCLDKWQKAMETPANYFENHDQIRSLNHFGDTDKYRNESAKMLCGLLLSLKGIPFIYQGEEIGMTNGDFDSLNDLKDVESFTINKAMKKLFIPSFVRKKLILQTTRDNARTPMQWDDSDGAGFTTASPWIQVNKNKNTINVVSQENDRDSILSFYKNMIEFRKASEALYDGKYRRVAAPKDVYVFSRESVNQRLYVYCNMSDTSKLVEFYGDVIVMDNYSEEERDETTLKPYEFRIVRSMI